MTPGRKGSRGLGRHLISLLKACLRRGNTSVAIYPVVLRTGPHALAVQYKEFWRKRPDCEQLKEDVVRALLEMGATKHQSSRPDWRAVT